MQSARGALFLPGATEFIFFFFFISYLSSLRSDTRGTAKLHRDRSTRIRCWSTANRAKCATRGSPISIRFLSVQRSRNTSPRGRPWTIKGTGCTWWIFRTRIRSTRKSSRARSARESVHFVSSLDILMSLELRTSSISYLKLKRVATFYFQSFWW